MGSDISAPLEWEVVPAGAGLQVEERKKLERGTAEAHGARARTSGILCKRHNSQHAEKTNFSILIVLFQSGLVRVWEANEVMASE